MRIVEALVHPCSTLVTILGSRYNVSMNLELLRGATFRSRVRELKEYLRQQPGPYYGTDRDLAKALFIGERTIARYLRFLRGVEHIYCTTSAVQLGIQWYKRRRIDLTPKSRLGFCDEEVGSDFQI